MKRLVLALLLLAVPAHAEIIQYSPNLAGQITAIPVPVNQGGTGLSSLGSASQCLQVNGGGTALTYASCSSAGVSSFSAGTTGFTPSTATTGDITLSGTLGVTNGGTGTSTTFTSGSVVFADGSGKYNQNNANFFWDNTNNRLGIGTTSPAVLLDVNGITDQRGTLRLGSTAAVNLAGDTNNIYLRAPVATQFQDAGGTTTYTYIASSTGNSYFVGGSVGIGTNNPLEALSVVGPNASQDIIDIQRTGIARDWRLGINANSYFYIGDATAGNTRVTVDSSGNMGIGTSTPASLLSVKGGAAIGTTYAGTNAAGANNLIVQGIVGIGTSAPLSALDVNGGLAVGTYAGTATAPSNGAIISGMVGIGTTSPGGKLEVDAANGSPAIIMTTDTGGRGLRVKTQDWNGTNTGSYALLEFATGTGNTPLQMQSYISGSTAYGNLVFNQYGGNVGIGTIAPLSKLDVNGGVAIGTYAGTATAPSNGAIISGSLGIGTSSPSASLHVMQSSNYAMFQGTATSSDGGLSLIAGGNTYASTDFILAQQHGTSNAYVFNRATAPLLFGTSNAERMRLDSSGNLGVGKASPIAKVDIAGNVSEPAWGIGGIALWTEAATYTDTTGTGTVSGVTAVNSLGAGTIAATATGVTYAAAANLYVAAPVAGANASFTTSYAAYFNGREYVNSNLNVNGAYTIGSSSQLLISSAAPTIASGFCSTSPSITQAAGTAGFTLNVGTSCSTSTGVLTFPTASHMWSCQATNSTSSGENAANSISAYSTSSTSVTVANYSRTTGLATNWTASDTIQFSCIAY